MSLRHTHITPAANTQCAALHLYSSNGNRGAAAVSAGSFAKHAGVSYLMAQAARSGPGLFRSWSHFTERTFWLHLQTQLWLAGAPPASDNKQPLNGSSLSPLQTSPICSPCTPSSSPPPPPGALMLYIPNKKKSIHHSLTRLCPAH